MSVQGCVAKFVLLPPPLLLLPLLPLFSVLLLCPSHGVVDAQHPYLYAAAGCVACCVGATHDEIRPWLGWCKVFTPPAPLEHFHASRRLPPAPYPPAYLPPCRCPVEFTNSPRRQLPVLFYCAATALLDVCSLEVSYFLLCAVGRRNTTTARHGSAHPIICVHAKPTSSISLPSHSPQSCPDPSHFSERTCSLCTRSSCGGPTTR